MSASGNEKLRSRFLRQTTQQTPLRFEMCFVQSRPSENTKKPQADSELRMISFLVEVEEQQYFDHLQLRKALLKLIPCQTCLLLFKNQNSKGI